MARRYAKGSRAWGHCSRTGDKVLLSELVKDGDTGLPVTLEAYEPKHPQERPVNVFDPQILRKRAPDLDTTGTFTTATFTWDPGSITDGTTEVKSDITVDGAAVGATVIVYPGVDLAGLLVSGHVNSSGKVSVVLANLTAAPINLESSTWQVLVTQEVWDKAGPMYVASFHWDPVLSIDGVSTVFTTVTVPGAEVGDAALVYPAKDLLGLMVSSYVSAADTVTVALLNLAGGPVEIEAAAWPLWRVAVTSGSDVASMTFFQQTSLSATFTWDPGAVSDGTTMTTTATVTGAAVGDAVILYPGVDLSGLTLCGYVSAPDTVTVVLGNLTGDDIDLASASWAVRVLER